MERGTHTERRIITCLVLDVVGSTDLLAVQLGPDRMKMELSQLFAAAQRAVESSGGVVEKFLGDGFLAVFGVPHAHEDDPLRALRASLDCVRVAEAARSSGGHLAIRLAVETGDAVVDARTPEGNREHGIVGVCVNLASRLQEKAGPGEVLVGPSCHEVASELAAFESIGPFDLKGLGVVPSWRLVRLLEAHSSLRPSFVGRGEELAQLTRSYERALSGRPTFVLVVGPPGQGKSRLIEEFLETVRPNVLLLAARCRPDDEQGSENPLRQLLRSDAPGSTAAALDHRLEPLIPDAGERGRTSRALAHSAGLELAPELLASRVTTRESEFARGWASYLEALSRDRGVVVFVEDLHWAEPSTTRLLNRLAEKGAAHLLIVATARPETLGAVALRPGPNFVQIDLGPLDVDAARALATSVGTYDPSGVERAQGNPLFLLELARASGHSGGVPLTIQAAIGAHLDALAPDDRTLLAAASVVGDGFQVREVACLTDRSPAEVGASLARLSQLRYVTAEGERFRLHHRLVRDVAYSRLTAGNRLRLHARMAEEGVPEGEVEAAAHHWWVALGSSESEWVWRDDPDHPSLRHAAFQAQVASARRHLERAASDRALEVARRAVQLASDGDESAQAEWLVADIYALRGEGDEAWAAWNRVLDAYRKAGATVPARVYVRMVRQACWIWGTFRQLPKHAEVVALMDEGSRTAQAAGDSLALAQLLVCRRGFLGSAPGLAEALEAAGLTSDLSELGDVLVELATVQSLEGDLGAALATCDRVDALVERGARTDENQLLLWRFMIEFHAGALASAERIAERAQALMSVQNPHYQSHTLGLLSWVAAARGRWEHVRQLRDEVEQLLADNPALGFCLVGASALAWGSVGDVLAGGSVRPSLEPLVQRMVPESAAIRASILFLPQALVGSDRSLELAKGAYESGTQFWDRQEWDQFGVKYAIGLVRLGRWEELEPEMRTLERVATHGGRLCAALREAVLEERARSTDGPSPRHAALRALGYTGLSELLSVHVDGPDPEPSVAARSGST